LYKSVQIDIAILVQKLNISELQYYKKLIKKLVNKSIYICIIYSKCTFVNTNGFV